MTKISGKCGCGNVAYEAEGEISGVVSCHCKFCQRLHGNYNPMVVVEREDFSFTNEAGLAWYQSSDVARRGFCKDCGSALFKEKLPEKKMLVAVGSLDDTSDWKNKVNVFAESAGEYYLLHPAE